MSLGPDLTQSGPHIGMHLNDIDREMTTFCRYARSVPICIEMDVNFPSLDQLRSAVVSALDVLTISRRFKHKALCTDNKIRRTTKRMKRRLHHTQKLIRPLRAVQTP